MGKPNTNPYEIEKALCKIEDQLLGIRWDINNLHPVTLQELRDIKSKALDVIIQATETAENCTVVIRSLKEKKKDLDLV